MRSAGPSSSGVAAVRYGLRGALVDLFLTTMGASSSTRLSSAAGSVTGRLNPVRAIIETSSTEQLGKRRRACTGKGIDALPPKRGDSPGNTRLSGARLEPAVPLETRGPAADGARRDDPVVARRQSAHTERAILASSRLRRATSNSTV